MTVLVKPTREADIPEIVSSAEGTIEIAGHGTKVQIGRPVEAHSLLDLSALSGIRAYEPEELVLEAWAGTPLAEIERTATASGQQLAFEPPAYSTLLGSVEAGTLGGTVACGYSGPRRIKAGAVRDHVLGVSGVTGRGVAFKAGARVVKNVTGYDLPKLMTGSFGTLAVLTSIIIKTMPLPETEATLVFPGLDSAAAVKTMARAMASPHEVSGAAHLPGEPPATLIRLEGIASSVAFRRDALARSIGMRSETLEAAESAAQWRAIRDALPLAGDRDRVVWRLSVPPSDAPATLGRIGDAAEPRYFLDWAGGLIWLSLPGSADAGQALVRGALTSGHATLVRAPRATRAKVDVFHPQAPSLSALTQRIKQAFDPDGRLNPGRMYKAV